MPVRSAFAMTSNKSQGQTLEKVGVWLEETTFTLGHPSRAVEPQNFHIAVIKGVSRKTRNVVYIEILSTGEVVSTPTKLPFACPLLYSD